MLTPQRTLKRNLVAYLQANAPAEGSTHYLAKPCFILSAPRAGSSLLIDLLNAHLDAHVSQRESHVIYKALGLNTPESLCRKHAASDELALKFKQALLYLYAVDKPQCETIRATDDLSIKPFIEKTPRHIVAIPFLQQILPQAQFLFLRRDAKATIASIIEAWLVSAKNGQFVTYSQTHLEGWHLPYWCFVLLPNWQDYIGKSVVEIAVAQWLFMMQTFLQDIDRLTPQQLMVINYQQLITEPEKVLQFIAKQLDTRVLSNLNTLNINLLSKTTISPPNANKWQRYETLLCPFLDEIETLEQRLTQAFKSNKFALCQ